MRGSAALVYPYFLTGAPEHMLFQPIGIASLSSQIKERGIKAVQYDCTFESFENIINEIVRQDPAVVGIYIMITMSRNALKLLKALKSRLPHTLFVAGGPLATLYPKRFAFEFDAIFKGEADIIFPDFCRDYIQGYGLKNFKENMDFSKYPGIYINKGSEVINMPSINHPAGVINNLPLPDREGIDHKRYQGIWENKTGSKPATIMITRGCPFSCDFCSKPVFGNNFRKRSITGVMKEIRDIKRHGYDQLWIGDDCFTLGLEYLKEFCMEMIESDTGITWTCLSRVDTIDAGVAELMKKAGCEKVYLGLESGSDKTLKLMKKRSTVAEGINAVYLFNSAGIKTSGFFMVGYPGETNESVEKTFSLALSLPLDEISFTVPYPLPGSALFSKVKKLDSSDDWDVENEVKFLFETEFNTALLRKRIQETMSLFRKKYEYKKENVIAL